VGFIVPEYLTTEGRSPYRDWLETLDLAVQARVQARILRFEMGRDMAKRSRDWNEGLARDLQNPAFAQEFLIAAVEEGIPVQEALGKVIRAMGVKEFAAKVGMASSNLLRAIDPRHNPTQETLNRLLRPFGLRQSLAPLKEPDGEHAA
jgi:DNA-binding phage protein